MKEFGDQRIAAGETCLVVDLGACTGMDSTFMGTLAGMAARLSTVDNGRLQIADVSARNRRSLEDLGLDFLMEVDPPEAGWRDHLDTLRAKLECSGPTEPTHSVERAKHVLEAHQELAAKNEKNAQAFAGVVALLESELEDKLKKAGSAGD
jgi:hypothetical protein